jgi:DNA-directed DNA polymerase III PolC
MTNGYVHLNVHTCYSLLSGAAGIEPILLRAKELRFETLAITDTNGLYGVIPFVRKARESGIRPILGAEIRSEGGCALCLVRDAEGYANLCRIITARQLDEKFSLTTMLKRYQGGLFILSPDEAALRELEGAVARGRLFREVRMDGGRGTDNDGSISTVPSVITNNVHFVRPDGYALHRVLTAIGQNKLISEVTPEELAGPGAWLRSAEEMAALAGDGVAAREALENSRRIAEECRFEFAPARPIFPRFFNLPRVPPELAGETPRSGLRMLAVRGAQDRYGALSTEASQRLDEELDVIDRLGFSEYFLIVWDIVNFARGKGIPIVGRGSAANSLVAWCLGITSPDPLAHRLPFERFLNLSRSDCPDIDLDMCWRRRDEVLQYVYERHGAACVAMVSNHNTWQARSAFTDVARVHGLPIREIQRLAGMLPHYSALSIREARELFPEARDFPIDVEPYRSIVACAEAIDGFPRHLSIHVGGIVIGDRALTHYLPLERAAKGLVITQYEMDGVEAIGLVKIDLLGHRSLTVIRDTVEELRAHSGVRVDIEALPDGDPATAALLREGGAIGCFQIESPGMRSLLKMIGAADRRDVIHALSLIRPGPSASGMKERFIRRRLGEEPIRHLDPRLAEVLGDTYGVMLFQEDILRVAVVIAGFTLEEGDTLRQAISKKRSPERMAALEERFLRGAAARGVAPAAAREIWKLISNFAGYSYCKAHAVTYGYLAWQATYLKAHHPAEFLAAVMSNQGGFYEPREYLEEARRRGVRILPPDVNRSAAWHLGRRGRIRIGLGQVKGLSQRAIDSILRARAKRPFASFEDFYFRTQVNDAETEKLVLCGALGGFGRTRPQLLWELRALSRSVQRSFAGPPATGFLDAAPPVAPAVEVPPLAEYPVERLIELEQEVLDLAVTDHPLRIFEAELGRRKVVPSNELELNVGRRVTVAGWLVTMRRAVTKDRQYMKFVTLEDRVGTMEVVLFPDVYRRFGGLIRSYGPYLVRGRVELNHRSVGLTAEWVSRT